MKNKKKNQKKTETIKSKSLKTGDKKLDGPNRPSV
ncbi:spore protein [Virgibacillus sp. C22-A2]|uniref:Spore protein n=1 Tax=Virgibacillus tibetensis TaxID=3042313 RepID=A0ABU6KCF2_9BACI|nr:spore protein [Virgibacillus sp. C22-A2]